MKNLKLSFISFLLILTLFSCSLTANKLETTNLDINLQDIITLTRASGIEGDVYVDFILVDIKTNRPLETKEIKYNSSQEALNAKFTFNNVPYDKELGVIVSIYTKQNLNNSLDRIEHYFGRAEIFKLTKTTPTKNVTITLEEVPEVYVQWEGDRTIAKIKLYEIDNQHSIAKLFPTVNKVDRNNGEKITKIDYPFYSSFNNIEVANEQYNSDYSNMYQSGYNIKKLSRQGIDLYCTPNINIDSIEGNTTIKFTPQINNEQFIKDRFAENLDTTFAFVELSTKSGNGWEYGGIFEYRPNNVDALLSGSLDLSQAINQNENKSILNALSNNIEQIQIDYGIAFTYENEDYTLPILVANRTNPTQNILTYTNGNISIGTSAGN